MRSTINSEEAAKAVFQKIWRKRNRKLYVAAHTVKVSAYEAKSAPGLGIEVDPTV